jgi:hypothetical protein
MDIKRGAPLSEAEAKPKLVSEITLNEAQRAFLVAKQKQYQARVKYIAESITFKAPEQTNKHYEYLDALAKEKTVSLLLDTGKVSLVQVQTFLEEHVRTFWNNAYKNNPESAQRVIEQHLPLAVQACENAIGVMEAYNAGELDKVQNAQMPKM